MLLRHQPAYPATDYVADHRRLLEALERGDPRTPELVAEHLRLSVRLIRDELAREAGAREAGAREAGAREAGAREAGAREPGMREAGARGQTGPA
jgi:hypothetical protein